MTEQTTETKKEAGSSGVGDAIAGVLVVIALGAVTRFLEQQVPHWAVGTPFAKIAKSIEFPVYAIALGLIGNLVLSKLALRDALSKGFRTELFIKTGLVLLGASINLKVLVTAAGPAIVQALLLISIVFGFTWWLGGRLGLEDKLRALLASAVSICGVSAAIAAAGAVQAKREQLAYTASLVIAFALPSIFLLPWLADVFNLSDAVAGAWIGGNIDTTAAVAASGAIAGENALQIATIVKTTQNALIGVVAIALTAYFALKVERKSASDATPTLGQFWERFPKFVLGFIVASTLFSFVIPADMVNGTKGAFGEIRTWWFAMAFVCIGLEGRFVELASMQGGRPALAFVVAQLFNVFWTLILAYLIFGGYVFPLPDIK